MEPVSRYSGSVRFHGFLDRSDKFSAPLFIPPVPGCQGYSTVHCQQGIIGSLPKIEPTSVDRTSSTPQYTLTATFNMPALLPKFPGTTSKSDKSATITKFRVPGCSDLCVLGYDEHFVWYPQMSFELRQGAMYLVDEGCDTRSP